MDAGDLGKGGESAVIEGGADGVGMGHAVAILRGVEKGAGDGDAAGVEVTVLVEQCGEATDEQAGNDKEGDGAGDFSGDEEIAGALAFASAGDAGGAGLHGGLRIDAHGAEGGQQSEEDGSEDGESGSGEEDGPGNVDGAEARETLGRGGDEEPDADEREQDAEGASDEGEDEGVSKSGADEAIAASAEGSADGEFALAGDGAGELQVGEIDAADEQNGADGGKEEPERGADVSRDVDDEGNDKHGGMGGEVARLIEGGLDGGQLGLGLLGGDADAEASDGHEVVIALVA